jgi:hypothetical protein
MAHNNSFEVFISGGSTSVDEYLRAMAAPKSELPKLTEQQKFVAKKTGVSEEEYRRGVLAEMYGESRMLERGKELGQMVQRVLEGLGSGYRVKAVRAEIFKERWVIRIVTPGEVFNVAVPRDIADDAVDSGTADEIERLKNCVLNGINRSGLIARH